MLMYTRSRQCRAGRLPAFSLALIFSFGLSNCAISPQLHAQEKARAQQEPENAATLDRGRKLFEQSCGFCHGVDATGARGPDLVRSTMVAHDVNGNLIGEIIRIGRPDKGMPALPLSNAQIADIAAYLHARAREALDSGQVPYKYPLSRLLTGNVQAGKTYFNGAGGCTACHSSTGDLAHVARRYAPLELEAHMLAPSPRPPTVTVTL